MESNLFEKMNFHVPKAKRKFESLNGRYNVVLHEYDGCNDFYRPSLRVYKGNIYNTTPLNIEDQRQKMHIASVSKKVDDVDSREFFSENYKHDLDRTNTENSVVDCTISKRCKKNVVTNSSEKYKHGFLDRRRVSKFSNLEKMSVRNSIADRIERKNSDSDACSVGSCSINDEAAHEFSDCRTQLPYVGTDILYTDAESSQCSGYKEETSYLCLEKKMGKTVHGLEMHAYRCTLGALYASGPLSWEQEDLLANLRIMLNITNDEYLTELRNLIPPESDGTWIYILLSEPLEVDQYFF